MTPPPADTPAVQKAFDAEAIHAGNFALQVDHEKVARETDALMERMSLAQKIHEIRGQGPTPQDEMWWAGGDESLGLAPWKMVDGPRGARAGKATAFPVAIARAASFDADLERRVGEAIGVEVAAKRGNVLLAPTINLLRHPGWGRAQETYSEDTHHTAVMGVAFVCGAQNQVLTSPKHFALNNLENTRFSLSADVDPRTLHEVYLPHFKRCVVEAGAASVMTACPWFLEAARILREHAHVSVGVHLTLNSEWQSYKWGPVLGATLFHVIKEVTWTHLLGWQWVALGLLIIINVVYFQQGLLGWAQEKWPEAFGIRVDDAATQGDEQRRPAE